MDQKTVESRRLSGQDTPPASAPLRTIHPDSARWNPSEISSRTRPVFAFLPGRVSMGPPSSGDAGSQPHAVPYIRYHRTKW